MAVILALTVTVILQRQRENYYRRVAVSMPREAVISLAHDFEAMNSLLNKSLLSPSDEFTRALATRLYANSLSASKALDSLPWQHELENVSAMLDDMGMEALRWAETGKIDLDRLDEFKEKIGVFNGVLSESPMATEGFELSFGDSSLDPYRHAKETELSAILAELNNAAVISTDEVEKPREEVPLEQCKDSAALLLDCTSEEVHRNDGGNSQLILFSFNDKMAEIDPASGKAVFYQDASCQGGDGISTKCCQEIAKNFVLDCMGIRTEVSGYQRDDGFVRVYLSSYRNDATQYDHDLVVVVDGSNGRVAAFHAGDVGGAMDGVDALKTTLGDLTQYPAPEPPEEADEESKKLCTIKTCWDEDRLCYCYKAKAEDGTEYMLYYDCETGAAVDLRVISKEENRFRVQ